MTRSDLVETQPERTALSWQRTGLVILGVAGLLAHGAVTAGRPALLALAGGTALLGLGVLGVLAPARYRRIRRAVAVNGAAAAPRAVGAVTAVVVVVALAALSMVLIGR